MSFTPPINTSNSNIIFNSCLESNKKRKAPNGKEDVIEVENYASPTSIKPPLVETINNSTLRNNLPPPISMQNFSSTSHLSPPPLSSKQHPTIITPPPSVTLTQKNEEQNLPPNPVPQNLSSQPVINPPPAKKPRVSSVELSKPQVQALVQTITAYQSQIAQLRQELYLAQKNKNQSQSTTQASPSTQAAVEQNQSLQQTNKKASENLKSTSQQDFLIPMVYNLSPFVSGGYFKNVFRPNLESKVLQILRTPYKGIKPGNLQAIIVGPSGCGKYHLFENIASRILRESSQSSIPTTVGLISANQIIQSCSDLNRIESAIKSKIEEIFADIHKNHPGRCILGIRPIDKLFTTSQAQFLAATFHSLLVQYPNIQVVGMTSEEGYQKTLQQHPLFSTLFQPVQMETMDKETTLKVLTQHYSDRVESHILEAVVNLSNRYLPQESNPLKSINLIEDCFVYLSLQNEKPIITQELLWRIIANKAKIPFEQIQEDTENSVELFEKKLKEAVIGQDHVLKAVAEDILCFKGGWNNAQKPPMIYVFAGPTGVGKTELAKKIAKVLFGSEKNFIRLDMGEYHAPHTKARLIGSPPGYVGYNEGGQLTGALEKTPSCVVLLDEIEKAHPEVLKLFLPVFDEGRLSSSQGKEFNCKNVCFIMTTNLGAKELEEKLKIANSMNEEQMKEVIHPLISSQFGPEWLNRVKVFPFFPLTKEKCQEIVAIHLNRLAQEFADQKQIQLTWTADVVTLLAEKGFDPLMGARPLIQQIDKTIRLAMAKAAGPEKIQPRNQVHCSVNSQGEIQIHNTTKK